MANISAAVDEKVYRVTKWLGVNQAQEGESRLASGEAADMRNFRITAGGALRKRPGSRNVAGLLSAYTLNVDTGTTNVLFEEAGSSSASLTMYPTATVNGAGQVELSGQTETVTNLNADSHKGWYYKDENGQIYKFAGIWRTEV